MATETISSQQLLSTPVTYLKGVGEVLSTKLSRLSIYTIQDLLFHLPARYIDKTKAVSIAQLALGESAVICGEVTSVQVIPKPKRRLLVSLSDDSGSIELLFFHFRHNQVIQFKPGMRLQCFGEAKAGRFKKQIVHPEYKCLQQEEAIQLEKHLTPVYPTTEGVAQGLIRRLVNQVFSLLYSQKIPELIPETYFTGKGYPSLTSALKQLHYCDAGDKRASAQVNNLARQRLALEELLTHQLAFKKRRALWQNQQSFPIQYNAESHQKFNAILPFQLTCAQKKVLSEIFNDLTLNRPMLRLVQGDVGSGKTVVAATVAFLAMQQQHQVAMLAPTEVLAEQHFRTLTNWFNDLGIKIGLLVSNLSTQQQREVLTQLESGKLQFVIGTHAIFQARVQFKQLALVIVDEQHKFGVNQRHALAAKTIQGFRPHQLVMTATPIPRTLAMTFYADLDCSVIDELPPGRQAIQTVAISSQRRQAVIERVLENCSQGKQAYWVCPLIDESEKLTSCQAVTKVFNELSTLLPGLRLGLIHGRLESKEKEQMMQQFKAHALDLLIATTVIEVGVDVPNATLMVIENAERLGLAQLHQLRGRVGRGSLASHCVLLYQSPLSLNAKARLEVLRQTNDGFRIAEKDLELRGPGEVLGTKQTGEVQFKIANLFVDQALIGEVQQIAQKMLQYHPDQTNALLTRWLPNKLVLQFT